MLEKLMNCWSSSFASGWRSLLCEFYRNLNHNLNITTHAIDIGLFTTMLWTFEEREKLLCFNECMSGTRFHSAFLQVGRLRYDVSLFWLDAFVFWLIHYSRQLREVHHLLSLNQLWTARLYEIGIVSKAFCLYFGLSGVLVRSSGVWCDARLEGYEFYHCLKYGVFISLIGDSLDRYVLRMNEIVESCRLIYGALYLLMMSYTLLSHSSLAQC
jgi:NADH-quinone oxidoreductase subunit D